MAMWSEAKMPGDYSLTFHDAITTGPGTFVLATGPEKDCRREGNRFNAFRASLRRNPSHPTAARMAKLDLRLQYKEVFPGRWQCLCITKHASTLASEIMNQLHK